MKFVWEIEGDNHTFISRPETVELTIGDWAERREVESAKAKGSITAELMQEDFELFWQIKKIDANVYLELETGGDEIIPVRSAKIANFTLYGKGRNEMYPKFFIECDEEGADILIDFETEITKY
jgi:hypothetical protein